MSVRDLIPWNRGRDVTVRRGDEANPFLALHREMNRLFDDVFRGFDLAPFGFDRGFDRASGWPNIEVSDTDKELKVTAELPGLEEKDVELELANGVLAIKGEKKTETEDKERLFSEIGSSVIATADPTKLEDIQTVLRDHAGVWVFRLGDVMKGNCQIVINEKTIIDEPVAALKASWSGALEEQLAGEVVTA